MPNEQSDRVDRESHPQTDPIIFAPAELHIALERARCLVAQGAIVEAIDIFVRLLSDCTDTTLRASIVSDLATTQALLGNLGAARTGFQEALSIDMNCETALHNLASLASTPDQFDSLSIEKMAIDYQSRKVLASASESTTAAAIGPERTPPESSQSGIKVAILSFLFNWPSTGGGIVHTVELAQFLAKAGYSVRHFFARYLEWGIGQVSGTPAFPSEAIEFDPADWHTTAIQERFRTAVDNFGPDYVIITDSWNFKPLLAEAVRDYPYLLRLQAMECICPLTNVRLLVDERGQPRQCQRQQLAEPDECRRCLGERGSQSGRLHQNERALSGVGTARYHELLLRSFREAEAVLVVNPLTAAIVAPFCKQVRVVTAGMDPRRFSGTSTTTPPQFGMPTTGPRRTQIFFAGVVEEYMKGFHVLHQACSILQTRRGDFELVATGDPPERQDDYTRFIGWLSQDELAAHLRTADILVMPTVAQEALGRSAVEAMAAGRPVIASSLGGLPFTVKDGVTGLLCKPDDPHDLAEKIEFLLNNPVVREQMGRQGRERFDKEYAWQTIIQRHYVPLLRHRRTTAVSCDRPSATGETEEFEPATKPLRPVTETVDRVAPATRLVHLSLIVSVLESYEVVRRQLLHLNSVLTPDCELILVDDGSSPSLEETCGSVVKNYSFRLLLTHDRRDWTQPKARNMGAAAARGRKLLFFDIDHIITPSIVETALKFEGDKLHWERRPGILDEHGEIVTDVGILNGHGMRDPSASVHINSFVIRRKLFETLGGYDERFCGSYGGDDVDFNGRYNRLCQLGRARPDIVAGEGYVYPDPAFNGGSMFHRLPRIPADRDNIQS